MKKKHKKIIIHTVSKNTSLHPWNGVFWACSFSLYCHPEVRKVMTVGAENIKSDDVLGAYKYFCDGFRARGYSIVTPKT